MKNKRNDKYLTAKTDWFLYRFCAVWISNLHFIQFIYFDETEQDQIKRNIVMHVISFWRKDRII